MIPIWRWPDGKFVGEDVLSYEPKSVARTFFKKPLVKKTREVEVHAPQAERPQSHVGWQGSMPRCTREETKALKRKPDNFLKRSKLIG
jgi:hypothetical protein